MIYEQTPLEYTVDRNELEGLVNVNATEVEICVSEYEKNLF